MEQLVIKKLSKEEIASIVKKYESQMGEKGIQDLKSILVKRKDDLFGNQMSSSKKQIVLSHDIINETRLLVILDKEAEVDPEFNIEETTLEGSNAYIFTLSMGSEIISLKPGKFKMYFRFGFNEARGLDSNTKNAIASVVSGLGYKETKNEIYCKEFKEVDLNIGGKDSVRKFNVGDSVSFKDGRTGIVEDYDEKFFYVKDSNANTIKIVKDENCD